MGRLDHWSHAIFLDFVANRVLDHFKQKTIPTHELLKRYVLNASRAPNSTAACKYSDGWVTKIRSRGSDLDRLCSPFCEVMTYAVLLMRFRHCRTRISMAENDENWQLERRCLFTSDNTPTTNMVFSMVDLMEDLVVYHGSKQLYT
jgi:hypothetical protein